MVSTSCTSLGGNVDSVCQTKRTRKVGVTGKYGTVSRLSCGAARGEGSCGEICGFWGGQSELTVGSGRSVTVLPSVSK